MASHPQPGSTIDVGKPRWDSERRARVLDMAQQLNLGSQPHIRVYATEAELQNPNHQDKDDCKLIPIDLKDDNHSTTLRMQNAIARSAYLPSFETDIRLSGAWETAVHQHGIKINKIVALGLGEHDDTTGRWAMDHVLIASIVRFILNRSEGEEDLDVLYQTTVLADEKVETTDKLKGLPHGASLPRPVKVSYLRDFSPLNQIDDKTFVILLAPDNPWRQFLGTYMHENSARPAVVLCHPVWGIPEYFPEVRDQTSDLLIAQLNDEHYMHVPYQDYAYIDHLSGNPDLPKEILRERLALYLRMGEPMV